MASRFLIAAVAMAFGLGSMACRSETPQQETPAETASTESHEGHQVAKVTFAEPKDGATVGTLTKFVFQSENYQIAAVPQGELTEARPDIGHFHLGVDTDCLSPGTVIPKAEAGAKQGTAGQWIHFGTGSNNIEMALNPGPHKMSVQVGDDLHRAVDGLCETINITVK